MYLPPFLNDNPASECIGYSPISGYSSDGFKRKEEEGLIGCIVDVYLYFFPCSILLILCLWNCIDYTLWMIFHKFVSFVYTIITTTLFYFIERVIEPYCTAKVYCRHFRNLCTINSLGLFTVSCVTYLSVLSIGSFSRL